MPKDAKNIVAAGDTLNLQSSMELKAIMVYYRETFTKMGLKQRSALYSYQPHHFSMVFDGDVNGMAIVVQAVDLGNGTTNINLRYEKV